MDGCFEGLGDPTRVKTCLKKNYNWLPGMFVSFMCCFLSSSSYQIGGYLH